MESFTVLSTYLPCMVWSLKYFPPDFMNKMLYAFLEIFTPAKGPLNTAPSPTPWNVELNNI